MSRSFCKPTSCLKCSRISLFGIVNLVDWSIIPLKILTGAGQFDLPKFRPYSTELHLII